MPANFAEPEEVIELAKVAARYGGIYVSHMRNEADGLLDSVAETIRVAREGRAPRSNPASQSGRPTSVGSVGDDARHMIDDARAEGTRRQARCLPVHGVEHDVRVLFPQWALAGGTEAFAERLRDPERARASRPT